MLLGLVQLWADTFMMHQDKYPGYFQAYRTLCFEKVSFPFRDPNIRILMESVCQESPMYDHIEEMYNRTKPVRQKPEPKPAVEEKFDMENQMPQA